MAVPSQCYLDSSSWSILQRTDTGLLVLQVPEPLQPVSSSTGSMDQVDLKGSSSVGRGRTQNMEVSPGAVGSLDLRPYSLRKMLRWHDSVFGAARALLSLHARSCLWLKSCHPLVPKGCSSQMPRACAILPMRSLSNQPCPGQPFAGCPKAIISSPRDVVPRDKML